MAVKVIKTTFQLKRADSLTWLSLNPILSAGEPGFELDTHRLKIGDGKTDWNHLTYINGENNEEVLKTPISKEQILNLFRKEKL